MSLRKWMAGAAMLALMVGCDDDSSGGEAGEGDGRPADLSGYSTHLDMLAGVHLADVEHQGLFLDFGTPAQSKYTVGDWNSGWGSRVSEGDVTYAHVGRRGRVYFDLEDAGPITLRVRLRPHGTGAMTPYFNNEQLQSVFFEGDHFQDVDVQVPSEHTRRGENYLLLTFGGTTAVGSEDVSVAVDSIRVVPGEGIADDDHRAPYYESLVQEVRVADEDRRSLVTRRSTSVRFYTEVPEGAKLTFGLGTDGPGPVQARVLVTAEGAQPVEVFSGSASAAWADQAVDLDRFAGRVVRIAMAAGEEGQGRVAWSRPAVLSPPVDAPSPEQAKNVVVLVVDTLRAEKLRPFNPRSRVQAPAIERLAEEGTVFELAQSPENWTKPSVASMLTALHPRTHETRTQEAVLGEGALLLSEHFKGHGFATGGFIANGYVSDRFGFDQGWDRYRNFIREGADTDASSVFEEAGAWAEQHKDERFFLYVQTIDPHVPYDPGDTYLRMYDERTDYDGQVSPRRTGELLHDAKRNPPRVTFSASDERRLEALHDGEISQHDEHLTRFIERLDALGVLEETLIVLTSDHGEEFNEHGSWGHGHSVYQELLNVPLLFRMPGAVPAGGRVAHAVSTMDLGPTVLELAGVEPLPVQEGRSLVGDMHGVPSSVPNVAFSEFLDERRVIVAGRWKLIVRGNLTASMFDLKTDPGEESQLDVTAHPIAARYCRILHGQFLGATDRSRWLDAEQGRGIRLEAGQVQMDDALQSQLEALGYLN